MEYSTKPNLHSSIDEIHTAIHLLPLETLNYLSFFWSFIKYHYTTIDMWFL